MDDDKDITAADELEERIDAYLSGRLGTEETRRFEQQMSRPELAELVWQELALRDLLQTAPPEDAHGALYEAIERELGVTPEQDRRARRARRRGNRGGVLGQVGSALFGAGWVLRGPAAALQGGGPSGGAARGQLEGLATMRYALGPLSEGLPGNTGRAVGEVTARAVGTVRGGAARAVRGRGRKRRRSKSWGLVRRLFGGRRG